MGDNSGMVDPAAFQSTTELLTQAFNGHGLVFTPIGEADVEKFQKFMQAGNWAWVSHVDAGEGIDSYNAERELARMTKEARSSGNKRDFLVQSEADGPYIGHVNVSLNPQVGIAMISYYSVPAVRNQGLGSQMAGIVTQQLETLSDHLGVHQVMARIMESNGASRRVAEKSGWHVDSSRPRLGSYLDYVKEFKDKPRGGIV